MSNYAIALEQGEECLQMIDGLSCLGIVREGMGDVSSLSTLCHIWSYNIFVCNLQGKNSFICKGGPSIFGTFRAVKQ